MTQGWATGWGDLILSIPSRIESPDPRPKIRMATTKVQKYSCKPWPKGCWGVAGRAARRRPWRRRSWLPVSTAEWMASLIMAALPVKAAAANLMPAIAALPARAEKMTIFEECPAMAAVSIRKAPIRGEVLQHRGAGKRPLDEIAKAGPFRRHVSQCPQLAAAPAPCKTAGDPDENDHREPPRVRSRARLRPGRGPPRRGTRAGRRCRHCRPGRTLR